MKKKKKCMWVNNDYKMSLHSLKTKERHLDRWITFRGQVKNCSAFWTLLVCTASPQSFMDKCLCYRHMSCSCRQSCLLRNVWICRTDRSTGSESREQLNVPQPPARGHELWGYPSQTSNTLHQSCWRWTVTPSDWLILTSAFPLSHARDFVLQTQKHP